MPAPKKPAPRHIYLNGSDTGLKAHSPNDAIAKMSRVLQRRGHHNATPERVALTKREHNQRVWFTWPPEENKQ